MSFGSAKDMPRVLRSSSGRDILVFNLTDVTFIDSSASITLEEVMVDIQKQGDIVILCGMRENVKDVLSRFGILDQVKPGCVVPTRLEALRQADKLLNADSLEPGQSAEKAGP